jgi:lipopolysaccharide/colanic/teichoic acid biosynthesis glycosyltransferase
MRVELWGGRPRPRPAPWPARPVMQRLDSSTQAAGPGGPAQTGGLPYNSACSLPNFCQLLRSAGQAKVGQAFSLPSSLFDKAAAAAGLAVLTPVFLLIAMAILLDDGPPVFFTQTRVGKGGRPFRIWKFRTMRDGVRGSTITAAGDRRITGMGAILRKLKLDELPQLLNVLRGEMSLVGPRPEVPEYVQLETPAWQRVLQVPPGITDPASLLYRDEEEILGASRDPVALYREQVLPAKLLLNLAYLRSRSFLRDLRLILLTIRYSLFPTRFDPDLLKRTFGIGVTHDG